MPSIADYGTWASPVTTDLIIASAVGLGEIWVDGDDIWWSEARPEESGRNALVRRSPDDVTVLPAEVNDGPGLIIYVAGQRYGVLQLLICFPGIDRGQGVEIFVAPFG